MSPEDYQKVKQLFHAALELSAIERKELLSANCPAEDLSEAVEKLLAAHYEAVEFIETPAVAFASDIFVEDWQNRRVGNYRIEGELGRGGMGVVFLASRADDEFRQKVALKIVQSALNTEEIRQRFRQERQILAGLEHPNIARLLDGGTTNDGLPYFVMEYVEGLPLNRFCAERQLDTNARLEIFRQVCAAAQYAHQHLIVHRDIKPSNILVTTDGTPKLLDFGIAKLVSQDENQTQTATNFGAMTPDYASPEQMRGEKITTATDVYSLGKVLSELLQMRNAEREKRNGKSVSQPNSALRQTETIPHSAFRIPHSKDLQAILQTALRDEPERRYKSVEQFSEDVRRYLENLPVVAQTDSFGYRASKFVKRNRIAVGAAVLIFVLLTAGVVSIVYQARIAAAERDRAQIAQLKAERINKFLQDTLGAPNPNQEGREVKVIEVLEKAVERAEIELADQPEVLAEVQRTVGFTYYNLEVFDKSEPLLRSALKKFQEILGENHPTTAGAMKDLGSLLAYRDEIDEAIPLLQRAVEIFGNLPNNKRDYANAKYSLAQAFYFKGDTGRAEQIYREILDFAIVNFGADDMLVADVSHELANIIRDRDDEAAIALYRQSERIVRPLPDKRMNLGTCLANLGMVLTEVGRFDEAEPVLRESLAIRREMFGENSQAVSFVLTHLSRVNFYSGDYAQAERESRQAVGILEKNAPRGHRNFAPAYVALGRALMRQAKFQEAEKYLREGLLLHAKKEETRKIAVAETSLGECLILQKRYAEAEPLLLKAHEGLKNKLGERHPRTVEAIQSLITLYDDWQKFSQKEKYLALIAQ